MRGRRSPHKRNLCIRAAEVFSRRCVGLLCHHEGDARLCKTVRGGPHRAVQYHQPPFALLISTFYLNKIGVCHSCALGPIASAAQDEQISAHTRTVGVARACFVETSEEQSSSCNLLVRYDEAHVRRRQHGYSLPAIKAQCTQQLRHEANKHKAFVTVCRALLYFTPVALALALRYFAQLCVRF